MEDQQQSTPRHQRTPGFSAGSHRLAMLGIESSTPSLIKHSSTKRRVGRKVSFQYSNINAQRAIILCDHYVSHSYVSSTRWFFAQVAVNIDGSPRAAIKPASKNVPSNRTPIRTALSESSPASSLGSGSFFRSERPRTVRFQDDQAAFPPELSEIQSWRRKTRATHKRPHNDMNEVSVAER